MAFAGHLEFAAQSPQQLPHATFAQRLARALLDPRLRVPRLTELPGLQPLDQLGLHRPAHRRARTPTILAFQQSGHPAHHHLVPVDKNTLPRNLRHPHDLRHRQLVLRDQTHHQQPPPRPCHLRLRPRRFDLGHQFRSQFRQASSHARAERVLPHYKSLSHEDVGIIPSGERGPVETVPVWPSCSFRGAHGSQSWRDKGFFRDYAPSGKKEESGFRPLFKATDKIPMRKWPRGGAALVLNDRGLIFLTTALPVDMAKRS